MKLHRLVLALVALCGPSACAKPNCKERVEALAALSKRLEPEQGSGSREPVTVTLFGFRSPRGELDRQPDWKKRGLRLEADVATILDPAMEAVLARDLTDLNAEGKIELCVAQTNAPVEQKLSLSADPKFLAPLLAEVSAVSAEKRASLLAERVEREAWSCELIPQSFAAVQYVSPAERLGIVAGSVAESLQACDCPAADTEKIFALLTLMADVWDDKQQCAPLVIGKAPDARPVALTGPIMNLLNTLTAAGPAGVTFVPPAHP